MRITGTVAMVAAAVLGLSAADCASAGSPRDGGSAYGQALRFVSGRAA